MQCSVLRATSASGSFIWCTWATASIIAPSWPNCPTGRRRPLTGSSSKYDQRPDARRPLSSDGGHARDGRADIPPRAGGEDADDGFGLGRDLRRRFYPVHIPRQSWLGRATVEVRGGGHARYGGEGNAHPD